MPVVVGLGAFSLSIFKINFLARSEIGVRSYLTLLWISVAYYRNNGLGVCGGFLLMGDAGISIAKLL